MSRFAVTKRLVLPAALVVAALVCGIGRASAQSNGYGGSGNACGVPPSGLVRLWAGIGCQGQSTDIATTSVVNSFPAYSVSNGTGQWIALSDTPDPSQANHTLLIQNGCYYPDLSQFRWQNGQSWVGNIRAVAILPPGGSPDTYPYGGNKVIGKCS